MGGNDKISGGNLSDIIFGEKLIGISVLVFCFLFMPLFLYYRYRNKKLDDYLYKD